MEQEQTGLPFRRRTLSVRHRANAFVEVLERHGGWVRATELARILQVDDRQVRELASASDGRVISGQLGYRAVRKATLEEVRHAANWLRHQAGEMTRRAVAIERVLHNGTAAHS